MHYSTVPIIRTKSARKKWCLCQRQLGWHEHCEPSVPGLGLIEAYEAKVWHNLDSHQTKEPYKWGLMMHSFRCCPPGFLSTCSSCIWVCHQELEKQPIIQEGLHASLLPLEWQKDPTSFLFTLPISLTSPEPGWVHWWMDAAVTCGLTSSTRRRLAEQLSEIKDSMILCNVFTMNIELHFQRVL